MFKNLLFILFYFVVTSVNAQSGDTVQFIVKWHPSFEFAGVYAALEKGFFAEEGLKVEIETIIKPLDVYKMVVENQGVYSVANSRIIQKRAEGFPLVIMAPIYQHTSCALFVKKKSNIRHPQDLKEKKIIVAKDLYPELTVMMNFEGIDPSSANFVTKWNKEAFLTGDADAITDYTIEIGRMPYPDSIRILRPIHYGVDFYGDCLYTSEKEIENHPLRVQAMKRAILKGWEYALNNPNEITTLIQSKYAPTTERGFLMSQYYEIRDLMMPDVVKLGNSNPGRWSVMVNQMKQAEIISPSFEMEGLLMEDYIEKSDRLSQKVMFWSGFIVLLVFVVVLVLFLINQRLNKLIAAQTNKLSGQNIQLKKMNEELDNFVYKVSHDLRAPISSSLGIINVYNLEKQENAEKYMNMIKASLVRMDQYIQDILNYSRNNRIDLNYSEIDFNKIINDTLISLSYNATRIRTEIKVQESNLCFCDESRLRVIFNNLISNSFRYADLKKGDPHLDISVKCVDDFTVIELWDNGCGIPRDQIKNVFKMFYRANDDSNGSGLGLYIVKEAVDKLNGTIEINSVQFEFTQIVITLPNRS
ncbi:MAG: ABC transporter substrate-binding protein [Cyclobacteriaceae bacterium]|nr:ABC transporter substrate-binding protein [Cyclobacteriaceae bacterium]